MFAKIFTATLLAAACALPQPVTPAAQTCPIKPGMVIRVATNPNGSIACYYKPKSAIKYQRADNPLPHPQPRAPKEGKEPIKQGQPGLFNPPKGGAPKNIRTGSSGRTLR